MSWSLRFAEPIVLPDGAKLTSLRESIAHLVKTIPAAERRLPAVLTAAEMLTAAAEHVARSSSRASPLCGQSTATPCASSIPIAKTIIGESGS